MQTYGVGNLKTFLSIFTRDELIWCGQQSATSFSMKWNIQSANNPEKSLQFRQSKQIQNTYIFRDTHFIYFSFWQNISWKANSTIFQTPWNVWLNKLPILRSTLKACLTTCCCCSCMRRGECIALFVWKSMLPRHSIHSGSATLTHTHFASNCHCSSMS